MFSYIQSIVAPFLPEFVVAPALAPAQGQTPEPASAASLPHQPMHGIKKETPHLFVCLFDGTKKIEGSAILPGALKFDYFERLKEECRKIEQQTPVYLAYMGRLLNETQIAQMKALADNIPNLFVIDYDEVEQKLPESARKEDIKKHVKDYTEAYIAEGKPGPGIGGIIDLVGITRLVLMHNSDIMARVAQQQSPEGKLNIDAIDPGVVCRDFDVTLYSKKMPDIELTKDHVSSSDFRKTILEIHDKLNQKAGSNTALIDVISIFFKQKLYDLDAFSKLVILFSMDNEVLNEEERLEKESIEGILKSIGLDMDATFLFSCLIRLDDSLLAVTKPKNASISQAIDMCLYDNECPYSAMQKSFLKNSEGKVTKMSGALAVAEACRAIEPYFSVSQDRACEIEPRVYLPSGGGRAAVSSTGKSSNPVSSSSLVRAPSPG